MPCVFTGFFSLSLREIVINSDGCGSCSSLSITSSNAVSSF